MYARIVTLQKGTFEPAADERIEPIPGEPVEAFLARCQERAAELCRMFAPGPQTSIDAGGHGCGERFVFHYTFRTDNTGVVETTDWALHTPGQRCTFADRATAARHLAGIR